jgi:hypothetical protein
MTEPYRPSNGTEGEVFMDHFCRHCERDAACTDDHLELGCPIIADAFCFDIDDPNYPKEWVRDEDAPATTIGVTAIISGVTFTASTDYAVVSGAIASIKIADNFSPKPAA